jgi:hypothetical protein
MSIAALPQSRIGSGATGIAHAVTSRRSRIDGCGVTGQRAGSKIGDVDTGTSFPVASDG